MNVDSCSSSSTIRPKCGVGANIALRAPFDTRWQLVTDHLSCDIAQGELFGLLGPNGAGKSTLMRMLATAVLPDAGSATIHGARLEDLLRRKTLACAPLYSSPAPSRSRVCVCAGEPHHKRKKALPFSPSCAIIELHRRTADGPREALWHILDPTDGPVLKACGNQPH